MRTRSARERLRVWQAVWLSPTSVFLLFSCSQTCRNMLLAYRFNLRFPMGAIKGATEARWCLRGASDDAALQELAFLEHVARAVCPGM